MEAAHEGVCGGEWEWGLKVLHAPLVGEAQDWPEELVKRQPTPLSLAPAERTSIFRYMHWASLPAAWLGTETCDMFFGLCYKGYLFCELHVDLCVYEYTQNLCGNVVHMFNRRMDVISSVICFGRKMRAFWRQVSTLQWNVDKIEWLGFNRNILKVYVYAI